jgi:hypothetical protein
MNEAAIASTMAGMMQASPGVRACALVDAGSGLIWHCVGARPEFDPLWEASADYWRMHGRLRSHFEVLGELGGAVMYHRLGILAIMPCLHEPELLMVCVAENGKVDWGSWQQKIRALATLLGPATSS